MKRTIKFHTDIKFTGGPRGEYKHVTADKYYLHVIDIAHKHGATVKNIKIYEWTSDKYSKVTFNCSDDAQWERLAIDFLTCFHGYIRDIEVKA